MILTSRRVRGLRWAGGLIVGYGCLGLLWPFAPMHLREMLAVGGGTASDTMHIVGVFLLSIVVLAATLLRNRDTATLTDRERQLAA